MSKLRVKNLIIFLLLFLICLNANAQEQLPKTIPTISDETHNKLLEILFPLDELNSLSNQFVTILRYKPSFENNQQIVIAGRDGKVYVTEYISDGNLWSKANGILERTKRDDPLEIAQKISVKKREFNIPLNLEQSWRVNLIDNALEELKSETLTVASSKTTTIILDGTLYEMWYSSEAGKLHYSLYGSEVSNRIFPTEEPFIRWMKLIRREISRRK